MYNIWPFLEVEGFLSRTAGALSVGFTKSGLLCRFSHTSRCRALAFRTGSSTTSFCAFRWPSCGRSTIRRRPSLPSHCCHESHTQDDLSSVQFPLDYAVTKHEDTCYLDLDIPLISMIVHQAEERSQLWQHRILQSYP